MSLQRGEITHLEKSLKKYLEDEISSDNITTLVEGAERTPQIRLDEFNDDWNLPVIKIKVESLQAPKPFIGQTKTLRVYLAIIDIYATNEYERSNLVDYITDKLEPGFDYILFANNPANPDNPTETISGHISITFLNNRKISFGDNVNSVDKYRHRISINCEIGNS